MYNYPLENSKGKTYSVDLHFTNQFKGRGGWNIKLDVDFTYEKSHYNKTSRSKTFNTYTTDSQFIDLISEMRYDDRSSDEIQKAYFSKFFDEDMEERILQWVNSIVDEIDEEDKRIEEESKY